MQITEELCLIILFLFISGPGTAHLNVDHFTMKRLVNRGSDAQFDCLFENSLLTEWYYRDIRLTNSSSQR